MKPPKLKSGITGFYDNDGNFVCTGSAMGRMSSTPGPCAPNAKFSVSKMNLDSGGYDAGGAYWGHPNNLYRAYSSEGNGEEIQESFLRAKNRKEAKEQVREVFPGAKFYC